MDEAVESMLTFWKINAIRSYPPITQQAWHTRVGWGLVMLGDRGVNVWEPIVQDEIREWVNREVCQRMGWPLYVGHPWNESEARQDSQRIGVARS